MLDIHYTASCTSCNEVVEGTHHREFLSPFFLPDYCPHCGEYRSSRKWGNDDWRIEVLKYKFMKPKFELLKPSTWFGSWELVEKETL